MQAQAALATLLPVEAGAAFLLGGDDGHLAGKLPMGELFEAGSLLIPVHLGPLGLGGGTTAKDQQAGEGKNT